MQQQEGPCREPVAGGLPVDDIILKQPWVPSFVLELDTVISAGTMADLRTTLRRMYAATDFLEKLRSRFSHCFPNGHGPAFGEYRDFDGELKCMKQPLRYFLRGQFPIIVGDVFIPSSLPEPLGCLVSEVTRCQVELVAAMAIPPAGWGTRANALACFLDLAAFFVDNFPAETEAQCRVLNMCPLGQVFRAICELTVPGTDRQALLAWTRGGTTIRQSGEAIVDHLRATGLFPGIIEGLDELRFNQTRGVRRQALPTPPVPLPHVTEGFAPPAPPSVFEVEAQKTRSALGEMVRRNFKKEVADLERDFFEGCHSEDEYGAADFVHDIGAAFVQMAETATSADAGWLVRHDCLANMFSVVDIVISGNGARLGTCVREHFKKNADVVLREMESVVTAMGADGRRAALARRDEETGKSLRERLETLVASARTGHVDGLDDCFRLLIG